MTMIDWVTAQVPCEHPEPINGGCVCKIKPDGEIEWRTETHLTVEGSHESRLSIKTDGTYDGRGVMLRIHGNPVKWLQGHNLFGTSDLVGLVAETMERLATLPQLGLTPSENDRDMWWKGLYKLSRVDVTNSYQLRNRSDVRAWIRAANNTAHMRHRGKGLMEEGTLYFGKHSRRWAVKFYSKGQELDAPGHTLPASLDLPHLKAWANDKLRCEAVFRAMELKRLYLNVAANWDDNTPEVMHQNILQGLQMSENHTLTPDKIEGLPPRLVGVYHLWNEGHDIRAMYPKPTFYRYRSQLLPHGIDIAIRQPHEDKPNNVVPLIRVLEATPAEIPAWAYNTPLLFEPRAMRA